MAERKTLLRWRVSVRLTSLSMHTLYIHTVYNNAMCIDRPAVTCVFRVPWLSLEGREVEMKVKWTHDTGRCVDASPLVVKGYSTTPTVFIGSHSGVFVAVCVVSGRCLWRVQLSDRIESSACLSANAAYVLVGKCTVLTQGISTQFAAAQISSPMWSSG